ncbi:TolC family protein [Fusobacterium sp.]|uniref:TolC family protein n=1 Tax=Fusobacterium sp. TaxID=68766 RepID=UPI002620C31A|nr:TolC family protein [Fusobacterium sp.]
MNKKIVFMFLMMTFVGCSMIPKIETKEILKTENIVTGENEQEKLNFTRNEWWTIYDDESLNSLIDLILKENLDLKIAELNLEKANEAIKLAESQGGFHIDLMGNFKRERTSKTGTVPPPFGGKTFNLGTVGLQSGYDVDIFNKFKSLSKEQKYHANAVEINSKWIELNLVVKTTKLYIYWKYLQAEENNLKEQKDIFMRIENLYKKSIKIGTGVKENLLSIENNIRILDSLIDENEMNKKITINNLNLLSGNKNISQINEILLKSTKSMDEIFKERIEIPQSINSDVIANRPDVEYYLMLINAQKEQLKAREADFYPQFSLNGSFGFEAINMNNLLKRDSILGFIGPSLYLPIFHEGSIRSNYKIAGIDLNIVIEEYNKAVLNAYNDVDNELYKSKVLKTSTLNSDENLLNEEKILYENNKKFNIGIISEYDYLLKEYNFLNKDFSNKQDHFKFYIQQLNLINAIGGVYKK